MFLPMAMSCRDNVREPGYKGAAEARAFAWAHIQREKGFAGAKVHLRVGKEQTKAHLVAFARD